MVGIKKGAQNIWFSNCDCPVKSLSAVMPDLIRHPGAISAFLRLLKDPHQLIAAGLSKYIPMF